MSVRCPRARNSRRGGANRPAVGGDREAPALERLTLMQRLASNGLKTPCNVQFRLFMPQLMLRRPAPSCSSTGFSAAALRINDDPRRHELGAPNRLEDLDGPPLTRFG
jgi:hypothetical protein